MGALATLLTSGTNGRSRVPTPASSSWRLGALGGSYFSATVAERGWPTSPYDALIAQAATDTGVDPLLIRAIIAAESAWRPDACSTSSCGLMQINYLAHGLPRAQVLDPTFNVPYGARVIGEQLRRRPTIQLALAGYNAGTSRGDADLTDRIARDVNGVGTYVQTVLDYLTWYQTHGVGTVAWPSVEPTTEWWGTDDELPVYETPAGPGALEVLAAVQPWQWALGGVAAALGLVLVWRLR